MVAQAPMVDGIFKQLVEACAALCVGLFATVLTGVSQAILNKTVVSWPHVTLVPMSSESASWAVDADINIPGLFGAGLDPYTATLSTMVLDDAGRELKTKFATSNFPKVQLKRGDNAVDFKVPVQVTDEDVMMKFFTKPIFDEGKQAKLFVDVDALTMHVLGFVPLPGKKLNKVLACSKATSGQKPLDGEASMLQMRRLTVAANANATTPAPPSPAPTTYAMQCFHTTEEREDVVV
jgi:hypothetical protein